MFNNLCNIENIRMLELGISDGAIFASSIYNNKIGQTDRAQIGVLKNGEKLRFIIFWGIKKYNSKAITVTSKRGHERNE